MAKNRNKPQTHYQLAPASDKQILKIRSLEKEHAELMTNAAHLYASIFTFLINKICFSYVVFSPSIAASPTKPEGDQAFTELENKNIFQALLEGKKFHAYLDYLASSLENVSPFEQARPMLSVISKTMGAMTIELLEKTAVAPLMKQLVYLETDYLSFPQKTMLSKAAAQEQIQLLENQNKKIKRIARRNQYIENTIGALSVLITLYITLTIGFSTIDPALASFSLGNIVILLILFIKTLKKYSHAKLTDYQLSWKKSRIASKFTELSVEVDVIHDLSTQSKYLLLTCDTYHTVKSTIVTLILKQELLKASIQIDSPTLTTIAIRGLPRIPVDQLAANVKLELEAYRAGRTLAKQLSLIAKKMHEVGDFTVKYDNEKKYSINYYLPIPADYTAIINEQTLNVVFPNNHVTCFSDSATIMGRQPADDQALKNLIEILEENNKPMITSASATDNSLYYNTSNHLFRGCFFSSLPVHKVKPNETPAIEKTVSIKKTVETMLKVDWRPEINATFDSSVTSNQVRLIPKGEHFAENRNFILNLLTPDDFPSKKAPPTAEKTFLNLVNDPKEASHQFNSPGLKKLRYPLLTRDRYGKTFFATLEIKAVGECGNIRAYAEQHTAKTGENLYEVKAIDFDAHKHQIRARKR